MVLPPIIPPPIPDKARAAPSMIDPEVTAAVASPTGAPLTAAVLPTAATVQPQGDKLQHPRGQCHLS
ncbi:hypothetical protein ACHAP3_000397 [Botrytis cinerea]|uniref:Uncharacterized protein n=1 Tax=Botryotinia fuckeliana (strain BcDW1) TaxID=1290391 RepID=M7UPM4_BOTF1|nr:hypothetical protein BcDW1_9497 [Botrytis cinerea BcDW1]EMR88893.1 hypothetical protein BcDW1_2467 [Botrytis cinerea BcDW1]